MIFEIHRKKYISTELCEKEEAQAVYYTDYDVVRRMAP
jgi:hypothetical protein